MLADHPDKNYVEFILNGSEMGSGLGLAMGGELSLSSARKNMKLAEEHHQVVTDYLEAEGCCGAILGPLSPEEVPGVHLSRFGVIPTSHQPGKWHLIVDLSHPEGRSVNDGSEVNQESLFAILRLFLLPSMVKY